MTYVLTVHVNQTPLFLLIFCFGLRSRLGAYWVYILCVCAACAGMEMDRTLCYALGLAGVELIDIVLKGGCCKPPVWFCFVCSSLLSTNCWLQLYIDMGGRLDVWGYLFLCLCVCFFFLLLLIPSQFRF